MNGIRRTRAKFRFTQLDIVYGFNSSDVSYLGIKLCTTHSSPLTTTPRDQRDTIVREMVKNQHFVKLIHDKSARARRVERQDQVLMKMWRRQ